MDGRDGRRLGALESFGELSRLVEDVREHPRAIDGLHSGSREVVAHWGLRSGPPVFDRE
jgi:hypothetical protein